MHTPTRTHTICACVCQCVLLQLAESFRFTPFHPSLSGHHVQPPNFCAPPEKNSNHQETAECIKPFCSASKKRKGLLHSQVQRRVSARVLLNMLILRWWFICSWTGFLWASQQISTFLNCSTTKMIGHSVYYNNEYGIKKSRPAENPPHFPVLIVEHQSVIQGFAVFQTKWKLTEWKIGLRKENFLFWWEQQIIKRNHNRMKRVIIL